MWPTFEILGPLHSSRTVEVKTKIKTVATRTYRRKSPSQHTVFLQFAADVNFDLTLSKTDLQSQCDMFYKTAHQLLDQFYPQRTVTVTSRDIPYITGHIKAMLRRKNQLMCKGRVDEASTLAQCIGKEITRRTKTRKYYSKRWQQGNLGVCVCVCTYRLWITIIFST